jgi:type III restriction enzyme
MSYEVSEPILNSPFEKPKQYWYIQEGEEPQRRAGRRPPVEVVHSHVNYLVPDTAKWEQSAGYLIDTHAAVAAFVKNAGLGFAIPYLHNGQMHDYMPDFIVRLKTDPRVHLILETKGFDPLEEVKRAAADRWVAAVNADGTYGIWSYALAKRATEVPGAIEAVVAEGAKG